MRLVAEHADACNIIATKDELPRKLDALTQRCAEVGRDPATITKTWLVSLVIAGTHDEAMAKLGRMLAERGFGADALDDPGVRSMVLERFVIGGPDEVAEEVAGFRAGGLDGVVVNMPVDGFDTDAVALAGEALAGAG
jgi:alkanesulfonate monooxygenase SsuD/methylene tetrahydromethanopterin reductase-like flavin-dependent oxidoreductase (luciferase family)